MEPSNGKQLSEAREHIFATKRSEGANIIAMKRSEERHMHWKLRYGTLLMVPQAKLSYGCTR